MKINQEMHKMIDKEKLVQEAVQDMKNNAGIDLSEEFEAIKEIINNNHYNDDFKAFTNEAMIIVSICKIYEKLSGEEITMDNITGEKSVMDCIGFFKKQMNIELSMDERDIKKLITSFILNFPVAH